MSETALVSQEHYLESDKGKLKAQGWPIRNAPPSIFAMRKARENVN